MSWWNLSPRGALQRMSEAAEVARFYRALGLMLSSGLPLTMALEQLAGPQSEPMARTRAASLRAALARGGTLSDGATHSPFLELEQALLRLGEETGFEPALQALSRWFEADHRLSMRIKSAMARPLLTMVFGCFILPLPVLVRSGLSAYLATALPMLALGLGLSGAIAWSTFTFIRGQPRYAVARLLWALAIGLEAGLPIQRCVQLAAAALGPCSTSRALLAMPAAHWLGRPLSQTLVEVCRLPQTSRVMLETMERTGDATNTLRWLASSYEDGTLTVR